MRRFRKPLIGLFFFVVYCHSQAAEILQQLPPVDITGTAQTMTGDELYREFHRMGDKYHNVDYQLPDGSWLAHKQISYGNVDGISSFELYYPGTNHRETVRAEEGKVRVDIFADGQKLEHRLEYRSGDVIDAGFDSLIRGSWEKIENRKTLVIRFLHFRRGRWVNMTVSPVSIGKCLEQYKSDITHCLSIQPEPLFLRILVPRILLGYNDSRQLRLYVGPSNLSLEKRKPASIVVTYQYSEVSDS